MRLSRTIVLSTLLGCLLFPTVLKAEYSSDEYAAKSRAEKVVDDMSAKFWRGLVNTLTGIGEIPRQLSRSCQKQGAGAGIPVGLFNGLVMTCVRTGVGAFEVVTFPVPVVPDDATPSCMTYHPVMQPVFVWDNE